MEKKSLLFRFEVFCSVHHTRQRMSTCQYLRTHDSINPGCTFCIRTVKIRSHVVCNYVRSTRQQRQVTNHQIKWFHKIKNYSCSCFYPNLFLFLFSFVFILIFKVRFHLQKIVFRIFFEVLKTTPSSLNFRLPF